jgi:uncharacterized protein (DUF2384 family)
MPVRTAAPLAVPLVELHNPASGRIDASRVATFLAVALQQVAQAVGANYATVHKTPDSPNLQKALGPIKRALTLVSQLTASPRDARAWLNTPHPDLGERTPIEVILSGRADAIVTLLENAIEGLPS